MRLVDLADPTPAGLAYLNLALASAIPVTWFLVALPPRPQAALAGLGAAADALDATSWSASALAFVALLATLLVSAVLPDQGAGAEISRRASTTSPPRRATSSWSCCSSRRCRPRGRSTPSAATSPRPSAGSSAAGSASRVAIVVPAVLFALAHGLGQSAPVFFDRFAFGLVAGVARGAHRRARGGHRDARAEQLAGVRPGARVRRHGHGAQPDRRHLVEHPGDPHPVAGLPRPGRAAWPGGWASRPPRTRPFWPPPEGACKVSPRLARRCAADRPGEGRYTIGIWCNWQHDWFWSS